MNPDRTAFVSAAILALVLPMSGAAASAQNNANLPSAGMAGSPAML